MSITAPRRPIGFTIDEPDRFWIIDQRFLPHRLVIEFIESIDQAAQAIRQMRVRGAPLIGVTAAWGLYLGCREAVHTDKPYEALRNCADLLKSTRPTAVNLAWAVDRGLALLLELPPERWIDTAREYAHWLTEDDVERCRKIGEHGFKLLQELAAQKKRGEPVRILTHCNAGRIACVEYGTATAPVYLAHEKQLPVKVWVDETRPRNQGALTAWELNDAGIDCTVVVDNAGGLLMRQGAVDLVLVGADRVSLNGDVANKIGTYLKALAAADCSIPFYVALPGSTFDPNWLNAEGDLSIEERDEREVLYVSGLEEGGRLSSVRIYPEGVSVANPGFDVTPARLITGLITERGICQPSAKSILNLFPEFQNSNE